MTGSKRRSLRDLDEEYPPLRLGGFELTESVGEGSMGEVWLAHHHDQNVDVALKVIVSKYATKRRFHRAFLQEVRSVAMLNHPFVVNILDYGKVDDIADDISVGRFPAGSPYLIMEYAEHGSLSDHIQEPLDWETCRIILSSMLDALAHSHARGVVHRDIKPHNILIGDIGGKPTIKLTDYGLAYALRMPQKVPNWHRSAGTPKYMSPEQITAKWRQYGASTDLYGLGCVAFELLTGSPPFEGNNMMQIVKAHVDDPIPELGPDVDIPEGVEQWIRVLLAKKDSQRFGCAAEAAWALQEICGPLDPEITDRKWRELLSEDGENTDDESVSSAPSSTSNPANAPLHSLRALINEHRSSPNTNHRWDGSGAISIQPPRQWKNERNFSPTIRMIGTGRGLFGLRRLPVIGRKTEQNHLWNRFRQFADGDKVGATLLSGPAGVGKDFLAQWLCDRSEELGVAHVFRASHEDSSEFVDGMARMIENKFSLEGLTREETANFLKSLLTDLDVPDYYAWESVTELIHRHKNSEDEPVVHFASAQERYMAYARFLGHLSREKPLIIWLNDVQWGLEALRFVKLLVERQHVQAPIYFVMTARDDLLADNQRHHSEMEAILDADTCDEIEIEPLDETSIRKVIDESLFLEASATYEAARRSGGNPMHALEIVGQWLDRDLLHATAQGFALDDSADLRCPDEPLGVWTDVIDALVESMPGTRPVLEIGAILGEKFHRSTWEHAAHLLGASLPDHLVETLLNRKYIYDTPQGLVFAQNLLREALFQSARDQGRWQKLCGLCATALDACSAGEKTVDERVGFLLIEAGEPLDGAKRLLAAARHRQKRRDFHSMAYLCANGEKALQGDSRPEAMRIRARHLTILAHAWGSIGKHELALQKARLACNIAENLDDEVLLASAQVQSLAPLNYLGDLDEARSVAQRCLPILEKSEGLEHKCATGHIPIAHIDIRQQSFDAALERIEKARVVLGEYVDAPIVRCNVDYVWLKIRLTRGDTVRAEEFDAIIDRCRKLNFTFGEAVASNLRAEVARREGALSEARDWYERSITLHQRIDPDSAVPPRLNLALVAIELGDISAAGIRAGRVLQGLRRTKRPQMELYAMAAMLPMFATRDDWQKFVAFLDEIEQFVEKLGVGTDADLAICFDATMDVLQKQKSQEALEKRIEDLLAKVSG